MFYIQLPRTNYNALKRVAARLVVVCNIIVLFLTTINVTNIRRRRRQTPKERREKFVRYIMLSLRSIRTLVNIGVCSLWAAFDRGRFTTENKKINLYKQEKK